MVLRKATLSMFVGDTSMWVTSDSVPELLHLLRDEITLLEKWMWDKKLTLNTLKIEFIPKSSIPRVRGTEETCCIHIQDERMSLELSLGITVKIMHNTQSLPYLGTFLA